MMIKTAASILGAMASLSSAISLDTEAPQYFPYYTVGVCSGWKYEPCSKLYYRDPCPTDYSADGKTTLNWSFNGEECGRFYWVNNREWFYPAIVHAHLGTCNDYWKNHYSGCPNNVMMCYQHSCVGLVRDACDFEATGDPGEYGYGYMVYDYTGEDYGTWWDYDTLVGYEK